MATYLTAPGQSYTVIASTDDTITSDTGVVLATATAGSQLAFTAPGRYVTYEDDSTQIVQNYKAAPRTAGSGGGGGKTQGGIVHYATGVQEEPLTSGDVYVWTESSEQAGFASITAYADRQSTVTVLFHVGDRAAEFVWPDGCVDASVLVPSIDEGKIYEYEVTYIAGIGYTRRFVSAH